MGGGKALTQLVSVRATPRPAARSLTGSPVIPVWGEGREEWALSAISSPLCAQVSEGRTFCSALIHLPSAY